jgi:hypothetical protein
MLIRVSEEIRGDHDEVRRLVRSGFDGVNPGGVEVHVEPLRRPRDSFTGLAYFQLPTRPRTEPGTRYLVRIRLPRILRNRDYPKTYRYPGRRTAPWITVGDWRERLLVLAAHEACHVWQFREGRRRSEVQAERWAAARLIVWRRTDAEEGPNGAPVRRRRRRATVQVGPAGEGRGTQLALFQLNIT